MTRQPSGPGDPVHLAEHFRFAAELGVMGASRDQYWRARAQPCSITEAAHALGINAVAPSTPTGTTGLAAALEPPAEAAADILGRLKVDIGPACSRCKLHALGRTQVVFGVGNPTAELMFVGEAPGGDEDLQGVPFVGRAGQLLTRIIEAMGLKRDEVYIANVIKCRPPNNRNPEPDEVEQCEPFLFAQIDAIQPRVIVGLGKFAAQTLLRTADPISRLRGRVFQYRGATLVPTFHPAYVLRNPASKREVWEDMKLVMRLLADAKRDGS